MSFIGILIQILISPHTELGRLGFGEKSSEEGLVDAIQNYGNIKHKIVVEEDIGVVLLPRWYSARWNTR